MCGGGGVEVGGVVFVSRLFGLFAGISLTHRKELLRSPGQVVPL